MNETIKYQLQDLVTIVMGQSPKGEFTNEHGKGIPLLNGPTEFRNRYPKPTQYTTDPKKLANEGDILWCVRGSTVGRRNFADQQYAIGRGLASVRSKHGNKHTELIGLLLDFKLQSILSRATGSTFPNISKEQLHTFEFFLPEIDVQLKIADIMSTIEHKIELNLKMNKTLEEMAITLYKHWLVDFGPFQDGEFVESELGMIPQEWKVVSIYDLAEYINGKAFKPIELVDNGHPVIKIAELKSGITSSTKYTNQELVEKYLLFNGDVLFAWSASLGVYIWGLGKAVLNQHIFNVQPKGFYNKPFLYFMLKNIIQEFVDIAASRATTMGHITKSHLIDKKIVVPPEYIQTKLQERFNSLFQQILSNVIEIEELKRIRNYLLPRLLSGEIDLTKAEKQVEGIL